MTGVALPINASAGSPDYDAREFRAAMAGMKGWDGGPVAGRQGIRPMGGASANIVTLSGSTITVGLHAGEITPGWASTTGTYDVALTVAETHAFTPADATNARKDIVIGRVYDHDEAASGGLREYRSEYIAGNAGPSPSEPAVPQGAIRLATIDVPFNGNGSPVVTNNYQFTAAAGGILPVRNFAERDAIVNPHDGQTVFRIDRGWHETSLGGVWRLHRNVVAVDATSQVPNAQSGQLVWDVVAQDFKVYNGSAWVSPKVTAQMYQSVVQGIAHATATPITFTTEDQDNYNGHSTSVNTSRYVFPRAGIYRVSGSVVFAFASSTVGYRQVAYRLNGSGIIKGSQVAIQASTSANTAVTAKDMQITVANVGDYIELIGQHNAGVGVTVNTVATASGPDQSTLTIEWVRAA